jgi:protein-L-isoaspartate(D-aspartate) O-methyltransferase
MKTSRTILLIISVFLIFFSARSTPADYADQREKLVKNHIIGEGIVDPAVIQSMRTVPREEFVPKNLKRNAYINAPLPIGYGQTISQPYIVALMTELLSVDEDDKVLEIGTGSGYQAAVLAHIVKEVYTIEIIKPLSRRSQETFQRLKYTNITGKFGDGYYGWKEFAPFDAIIVTAAVDHIPPPLLRQLKTGGRMCLPVGEPYFTQILKVVEKMDGGKIRVYDILPVRFVPFTRELKE